jgi:hypothetical protein
MPIEFHCAACNKMLRVPDETAGKKAKCPNCGAVMPIPEAAPPKETAPWPPEETGPSPSDEDDEYKVAPLDQPARDKPSVNPFADTGAGRRPGTSPFEKKPLDPENPYASPTGDAFTTDRRPTTDESRRTGPPWEREGQTAGTFFSTVSLVFGQTNVMFATMRREGGHGAPIGFAIVGNMVGIAAVLAVQLIAPAAMGGFQGQAGEAIGFLAAMFVGVLICAPVGIILQMYIGAGITHLMLMLVDGAKFPFETTFRVICYCSGTTALLNLIPFCGQYVQGLVQLVFVILGLAAAHEISAGKAALAVLLPAIICCALAIGFFAIAMVGAAGGGGGGF